MSLTQSFGMNSPSALSLRWVARRLGLAVLFAVTAPTLHAANQEQAGLTNGSFEESVDGLPVGWTLPGSLLGDGYELALDPNEPAEGLQSASLDSTEVTGANKFGMLNQNLDAALFQGKRVRFRAAVRTAERGEGGQAQLWLRADSEKDDGTTSMSAFDNMGDRPIQADDWQHYEIVADIDEDAVKLTVGVLAIGSLRLWIDDASFDVIDVTASDAPAVTTGRLQGAVTVAAPIQPFYHHWLWLAAAGVFLVAFSTAKNSGPQRFALRFSILYWLLYSLPTPLPALFAFADLSPVFEGYEQGVRTTVLWCAHSVLGIDGELVLPNGSGDTTYSFVKLLVGFAAAIIGAGLWSALDRKDRDRIWLRDALRTYLRYVLALTLLGYGLAKAGFISTQFGTLDESELAQTYGASSPMGLLWTFMAASPAYTFFSGVAEIVAGLLLIPRRTATLGGLACFAVMLNIVLLNFCYDVPVKLYSSHLMLMGVVIALPDLSRLLGVFVLNRPTVAADLGPPYVGRRTVWVHRALKLAVVLYLFALPIYRHTKREVTHVPAAAVESEQLLMNRGFRWINEYPFRR